MNASSESGECASLISTGSFSVFEAVCWPDMGLSVPIPVRLRRGRVIPRTASKRLPGPGAGSSQRDFPTEEGSIGDERRKLARRRGLRGAGPGSRFEAVRGMTRPRRSRTGIGTDKPMSGQQTASKTEKEPVEIKLAHSPDSDDAFMFYALATHKLATP